MLEPQVSVLTEDAVDELIPRLVFNIAAKAGWIDFHPDPAMGLDHGLMLGDYELPDESRDIFLEFLSGALTPLRERALKDEDALITKIEELNAKRDEWLEVVMDRPATERKIARSAKALIDGCIRTSGEIFTFKDLATQASPYRRKLDGGKVSAASITRLYQGKIVEGPTREAIAAVLTKELKLDPPCTRDELLPAGHPGAANPEIK